MRRYVPVYQDEAAAGQFDLTQLLDSRGVLVITLESGEGKAVSFEFDSYLAYRKLDEGDALLTLSAIRLSGGTGKWFYRVEDSDFLSWFIAERCGLSEGHGVPVHYVFAALNDILDVISPEPPKVKWLGEACQAPAELRAR